MKIEMNLRLVWLEFGSYKVRNLTAFLIMNCMLLLHDIWTELCLNLAVVVVDYLVDCKLNCCYAKL